MSRLLIVLFLSVSAVYTQEKSFITLLKAFKNFKKNPLPCANIVCLLQIFDQIVRPRGEKGSTVVVSFIATNGQDQQLNEDILCHGTVKTIWKGWKHKWVVAVGSQAWRHVGCQILCTKVQIFFGCTIYFPFQCQCWHANICPLVMFFLFWPYMLTIQRPWTKLTKRS